MVELFLEGGPFMWPILILLLAGLGLVGERAYSLNQSKGFRRVYGRPQRCT